MIKFPKEIKKVMSTLQQSRFEAYAEGECVRDSIAGIEPYAWDIATDADLDSLRDIFPEAEVISSKFGIIRMECFDEGSGLIIDIHTYRNNEGAFVQTIEEDLKRCRFVCDAIADNGMKVVDPIGGKTDINKKILKTVGDADELFKSRPQEMLRALAAVGQVGFDLSKAVYEAIATNYKRTEEVSSEIMADRFTEALSGGHAGKALKLYIETGLINVILTDKVAGRLTKREKSDMLILSDNIDRTQKVPERRLGLFYALMDKKRALPAIERLKFDRRTEIYLKDAVKDMPKFYFTTTATAMKKFMYQHETYDRLEYLLNLEKAQRIVFEWDTELKIRSKMYILDQIKASGEPVYKEDLCIDINDIMGAGIASDREEADRLLGYVTEYIHTKPKEHNRPACLDLARRFKSNPVARAFRGAEWAR